MRKVLRTVVSDSRRMIVTVGFLSLLVLALSGHPVKASFSHFFESGPNNIFGSSYQLFSFENLDVLPPELTGLNITPTAVDVSSGAAGVSVLIAFTDIFGGVSGSGISSCFSTFRSPSGNSTVV